MKFDPVTLPDVAQPHVRPVTDIGASIVPCPRVASVPSTLQTVNVAAGLDWRVHEPRELEREGNIARSRRNLGATPSFTATC
jgi:hypothetical protein